MKPKKSIQKEAGQEVGAKPSRFSLRTKIFLILALFAVVLLGVVWLSQFLVLEDVYRAVQTDEMLRSADTITANIDSENLEKIISGVAYRDKVSVMIVESDGTPIHKVLDTHSYLYHIEGDTASFAARFQQANEKSKKISSEYIKPETFLQLDDLDAYTDTDSVLMLSTKIITNAAGEKLGLLIESTVTPMGSTVRTLYWQLGVVSFIIVLCLSAIWITLTQSIANPIVSLTSAAKGLGKGDADLKFEGRGFTEIEELSQALNYASQEISEVEHLRRELIANVSHDLRTPLSLIKGYSEMIRDFPDENLAENLQVVIDETERLSILVNDMLDLSRLQNEETRFHFTKFDIVPVLRGIVSRHNQLLKEKGYTITLTHEGAAHVYADEVKITQVMYNLLSNAINYAGDDKAVHIRQFTKGNKVRIEVIDRGPGIDVKHIPHIWDRYYKSDQNHRRASVGTGLGLSIVKGVMSQHVHGAYGVMSTPGEGSTFYIELQKL